MSSMCYCCLESDCTKDVFSQYYCNGIKEIYSDMLLDTLNIKVPHDNSNMICEQCISELRRATEFKNKVVKSKKYLMAVRSLKTEIEQYCDDADDFDDKISVDFDENSQPIMETTVADNKVFVIKLNPTNSNQAIEKSPLTDIDDNEAADDVKETMMYDETKDSNEYSVSLRGKSKERTEKDHQKGLKQKQKQPESQNRKDLKKNSFNLVFYSNLCLFKSLKTKFGCFLCREAFLTIKELRDHSKIHSNADAIRAKFNRWRGLSYQNADISCLECTKCKQACIDLTDLKKHLIKEHDVKFGDAEHFLIPYKLEDSYDCVLCNEKFNTYNRLSVHMNNHYSNNVCEICGNSYINRISLRIHLQTRHKEKKCSLCSETFVTNYSRVRHMRKHHNSCLSKRYCLICGKTFRYSYQLTEHKILEHGEKRELCKCSLCPKTFPSTQNLKIHVRSVHVRERNFPCNVCEMRFFTKFDQKRHEKTHVDERSFACERCDSKFKGKDSLRRHLKRQHLGA